MKMLLPTLILLLSGLLMSCGVQNPGLVEPDDRYYNSADARRERKKLQKLERDQNLEIIDYGASKTRTLREIEEEDDRDFSNARARVGGSGTTIVNNNYYSDQFDMDDYYDFMYASRIRRFHRPMWGWGFYSPWYTNAFWYNPSPWLFGCSIYSTYSFWNPYSPWGWQPGFGMGWNSWGGWHAGWGMGWGNSFYNPWAWQANPFYNPWAFNPWMMNGFMPIHYAPGFMGPWGSPMFMSNNFVNGLNFNSFDQNTQFFGARNSGMAGVNQSGRFETPLNQRMSRELGTNFRPDVATSRQVSSEAPQRSNTAPANNSRRVDTDNNNASREQLIQQGRPVDTYSSTPINSRSNATETAESNRAPMRDANSRSNAAENNLASERANVPRPTPVRPQVNPNDGRYEVPGTRSGTAPTQRPDVTRYITPGNDNNVRGTNPSDLRGTNRPISPSNQSPRYNNRQQDWNRSSQPSWQQQAPSQQPSRQQTMPNTPRSSSPSWQSSPPSNRGGGGGGSFNSGGGSRSVGGSTPSGGGGGSRSGGSSGGGRR